MPLELVKAKKATVNWSMSDGGTPEVFVSGFIYDGFGAYLNETLLYLQREYGGSTMYLDCIGGLVSDALSTYDFVRAKGINLKVECYGMVASAATLYLCAAGAKNCSMSENCDLVPHTPYDVYTGEKNEEEAMRIAKIYAEHTGMSVKECLALMKAGDDGATLSAADAKKQGWIASVIKAKKAAAAAIAAPVHEIEVYQLQHKAAAAEVMPTPTMSEETTKVKRTFNVKLTAAQALTAMSKTGLLHEVEIDVVQEVKEAEEAAHHLAEEVGTIKTENEGLKTTVNTITGERNALKTTVDEVTGKLTAAEKTIADMKAAHATEIDALKAQLEKLGAAPVAGAAGGDTGGTQVVAGLPNAEKPSLGQRILKTVLDQTTETERSLAKRATA